MNEGCPAEALSTAQLHRQTSGLTRSCVNTETSSVLLSGFTRISFPSLGELTTIKVIVLFPALSSSLVTALRSREERGFMEPKRRLKRVSIKYMKAADSPNDLYILMETQEKTWLHMGLLVSLSL